MMIDRAPCWLLAAVLLACASGEPPAAGEPIGPAQANAPQVTAPPEPTAPAPASVPAAKPTVAAAIVDPVQLHPSTTVAHLSGITGDGAGALVAVGEGGTIMRSSDHGASWSQRPSGTTQWLRAVWSATRGMWIVGDGGTLLRSTDAGVGWQTQELGVGAAMHHIAGNARELFVGGEAGYLLRSSDDGTSWSSIATGDTDVLGVGSTKPGELWVIDRKTLRNSVDAGKTWTELVALTGTRDAFEQLWVGDERFVATGRNRHDVKPPFFVLGGDARSPGADLHWFELDARLIRPPVIAGLPSKGSSAPRIVLAGDGYAVLGSDDGGRSFDGSEQSVAMQSPYVLSKRALWAAPDGTIFAAGDHGALMRAVDRGRTWGLLVDGAREPLFGGALSPDGNSSYAAVADAVLRGREGRWQLLSPGKALPIAAGRSTDVARGLAACCTDVWIAPDGAIVAAGTGAIWRSGDDGKTWSQRFDGSMISDTCCWSLWGDERGVFGVDRSVVRMSTDGGKTWTKRSIETLIPSDAGGRLDLAGHGDDIYAAGDKGLILHSRDRGVHWTREPSGTTEYLYAAFVGPDTRGTVTAWAVGEAGMLLRSTGGGTWTRLEGGPTTRLQGVYGDASHGELYIVGQHGVSRSTDDGATWTAVVTNRRSLRNVFGDGRGRVLALGDDGVVLQISG